VDNKAAFQVFLRLPEGRRATEDYVKELNGAEERGFRQLPDGSQVALVRRTLLPDRQGVIHATSIVDSLQMRIFVDKVEQRFFEFNIDRSALLAGRCPLRAINLEDNRYFGFEEQGSQLDPFRGPEPKSNTSSTRCIACHRGEKLFTIASFGFNLTSGFLGAAVADVPSQLDRTIVLKRTSYAWGLLQGLRETGSP
jgi:hypothetical protein